MSYIYYALRELTWHRKQFEHNRRQQAKQEASSSNEHLATLTEEAAKAVKRLERVGFPDAEKMRYVNGAARPCRAHANQRTKEEEVCSQLAWNMGLILLGVDGLLYADQWTPCTLKDCDRGGFHYRPITADRLRYEREQGTALMEQNFLLSALGSLGNS